jgi:hypothetical protein
VPKVRKVEFAGDPVHEAGMNRPLPPIAIALGLAGLVPFVACGLAAANPGGIQAALALVAYGAVILSFLGGVHWGFALAEPDGRRERTRFCLGVVPSLVGWAAVLLTIVLGPDTGIVLLIAGFIALTVVEARARQAGLIPAGYMWLRWVLSAVVILTLVSALLLRLTGARLLF